MPPRRWWRNIAADDGVGPASKWRPTNNALFAGIGISIIAISCVNMAMKVEARNQNAGDISRDGRRYFSARRCRAYSPASLMHMPLMLGVIIARARGIGDSISAMEVSGDMASCSAPPPAGRHASRPASAPGFSMLMLPALALMPMARRRMLIGHGTAILPARSATAVHVLKRGHGHGRAAGIGLLTRSLLDLSLR